MEYVLELLYMALINMTMRTFTLLFYCIELLLTCWCYTGRDKTSSSLEVNM